MFSASFRLLRRVSKPAAVLISAGGLCLLAALTICGQTEELGDGSADPIKLFEQGQNAHAHGDFAKAVEYYDQAIKLKLEFPEAEFQKGNALVSLNRLTDAETAFRRAIDQRKNWAPPYSSLGLVLVRLNRLADSEQVLRQALQLEPNNAQTLRALADVRFRAGDAKEA